MEPGLRHAPAAGLPAVLGLDARRGAAGLTETLIQGKFTFSRSAGAVDNGTALLLDASASGLEYGLYAFDPQGTAPDSLAILLDVPAGRAAWVALADYDKDAWEWHGPLKGGKTLAIDEARYLSPGGVLYCAVAAAEGDSVTVNALSVRTINPQNIPPTADLQADVSSGDAPLTVHFDASASADSDGAIIEYAWDWDGNGGYDEFTDGPIFSHTFTEAGLRTVRMRVSDEQFARTRATVDISVTVAGNNAPLAELLPAALTGNAPLVVGFDASGSNAGNDSGDLLVKYEWDWDGDGIWDGYGEEATIEHTYDDAGSFTAMLRVTDSVGNQASDTAEITVNAAPVAVLVLTPDVVETDVPTILSGELSSDSDGSIVMYEWDSDADGTFETNTGGLNHLDGVSFENGGFKALRIRVTDNNGASATASALLRVDGWGSTNNVDSTGVTGEHSSLSIVNGKPAISYYSVNNGNLKFVRATNASGTEWDTPITVDSIGDRGRFTSLAIVSGNPAISYFDSTSDDLRYVRALDEDGTAWDTPATPDTAGNTGSFTCLAIVNGMPAISYYDFTNGDLRFVRATDENGTNWDTPVSPDSLGDTGQYNCLAIVKGYPAISYYDLTDGDLRFVRASDAEGTAWDAPLSPDSDGDTGLSTSLLVVNGKPAISYYDTTSDDLRYVRATDDSGTIWGMPLSPDSVGNTGADTSMIVINGKPAISYFDHTRIQLRYVRATDASGAAWGTPLDISGYGVAVDNSLAVVNGNPAISYFDFGLGNLYYVRFEP